MIKYLSIISSNYNKWLYLFVLCAFVNVLLDTFSIIMVLPLLTFLFDVKENVGSSFFYKLIENFFFSFGIYKKENIQIFFLFFFVFIFIIKNIYHIIFIYFQNKLFSAIEVDIGIRVVKNSLYSDIQMNNEKSTAEIIRDSSSHASIFIISFLVPFVQITIEIVTFGLLLLFIGYNYFHETIFITFLLLTILLLQYFLVRKKIFLISTNLEIANKLRIKSIIDSQNLFKEIKIFNLYQFFFKEYSKQSFRIMEIQNTLGLMRVILRPIIETLFIIGICFFIYMILLSDQSVIGTLPKIALFVLAAIRVIPSVNRLNLNSQRLRASKPVLISLYSKINNNNFNKTFNKTRKLSLKSKLKIKNLYFKYPNKNKFLFQNLNLELKKGKTYFLQGDSGIGKSTFVEILLGLLKPTSGKILVDNKNIKNNLIGWYKSLSYVPQKANIIQETLLNNILLFSEDNNSEKLVSILNLLNLNNLIKESEELGRRGAKISGGQVQRIAIARAMIKNSDFCVIDEGTAALDSKSEIDIVKKIIDFKTNNIILFISHKKNLKKYFDYSLIFQYGKIKKIKNGN